jgi:hypothetical protein
MNGHLSAKTIILPHVNFLILTIRALALNSDKKINNALTEFIINLICFERYRQAVQIPLAYS